MRAMKTHYLISTHQIPGIYNSPFGAQPPLKELELRSVRSAYSKRQDSPSRVKPDIVEILDLSGGTETRVVDSRYKPLPPISSRIQVRGQLSWLECSDKVLVWPLPFTQFHWVRLKLRPVLQKSPRVTYQAWLWATSLYPHPCPEAIPDPNPQ